VARLAAYAEGANVLIVRGVRFEFGVHALARWLILLITFAVWIATMVLIWDRYMPKELSPEELASRDARDAIFGDQVPPHRTWRMYADLSQLSKALVNEIPNVGDGGMLQRFRMEALRFGGERGEIPIGIRREYIKHYGDARVELLWTLQIQLPEQVQDVIASMNSPLLNALSKTKFETVERITLDRGVEEISMTSEMPIQPTQGPRFGGDSALILKITTHGIREGKNLVLTPSVDLANQAQPLVFPTQRVPADMGNYSPFMERSKIHPGDSWQMPFMEILPGGGGVRQFMITVRVEEEEFTQFQGRQVQALKAVAEVNDELWEAWYLRSGHLIKQHVKFMNMFFMTMVDEDPNNLTPATNDEP